MIYMYQYIIAFLISQYSDILHNTEQFTYIILVGFDMNVNLSVCIKQNYDLL